MKNLKQLKEYADVCKNRIGLTTYILPYPTDWSTFRRLSEGLNKTYYADAYSECAYNPKTMQFLSYCEGDISLVECANQEEYDAYTELIENFLQEA